MEPPDIDPGAELQHAGMRRVGRQREERQGTADRGQYHAQDGNRLRGTIADRFAQQTGDQCAEQRGQNRDAVGERRAHD